MLSTLVTRSRAVFACLVALGASWLALVGTERQGDPQVVVAEVDRQINEIEQTLKRYTYELKEAGTPNPTDKSRALYRLSGPKGELLFMEGPADPNISEVERIVGNLYQTGKKQYVSLDSAWSEVQATYANLTWNNKQIAEAKVLRQFRLKPESASSYDWDNRFRKSKEPWQIQESLDFQVQRAGYVVGATVGTFALVILVLTACGWLWRSMLARIRELSNAVRGK